MARLLWPVRSMATAIAAEARAPRRPPLRVARVQPEEPILQHGMQPLVWGGDSHFDHLDRQSLLAEGEGGGLGGHPNVESVVVFSVQPVVARRCCMKTLRGWSGLARISRDPPQEPHCRDEVEGSSHV